jgi:hypothetical protein
MCGPPTRNLSSLVARFEVRKGEEREEDAGYL